MGSSRRPRLGAALVGAVVTLSLAACASAGPARPAATAASPWPTRSAATSTPALTTTSPPATPSPRPPSSSPSPAGVAQLPRGGTDLFPAYRLVGYSGGEASEAFGRLGIGSVDARVREIEKRGASYEQGGRKAMPVLELITVIVHAKAGANGKYNSRITDAEIGRYLAAARKGKALLLLNIQPGRADFLPEVQALQRWLKEPDVGIALDPEWAVGRNETPGRVYGHTSAAELNAVARWLSAFTQKNKLPDKALVVHQLAVKIIPDIAKVKAYPRVQTVLSVDGIGGRGSKEETWKKLTDRMPKTMHAGFKLFFEEDREHGKLMTPRQVMKLRPTPEYVLYE